MTQLVERLAGVKQAIIAGANAAQRDPKTIQLLAVSKKQAAETIRTAYELGQRAFGENYVQEAEEKQTALADLDIEWHFIGPIQSNKTRAIAENFAWVHSVDRLKIAQRLNQARPEALGPLSICLQVNLDNEATKSGVSLMALNALAEEIQSLPYLCLRGLMAIPAAKPDYDGQYQTFMKLKHAWDQLNAQYPSVDTLSMGMSADMSAAIAAGSTIVRVGTAIFGKRSV